MARCTTGTMLGHEAPDCSGQPLVVYWDHLISTDGNQFLVASRSAGERLLKSSTRVVCMSDVTDSVQSHHCKPESRIKEVYWPRIYTPALEIRNSACSRRLEQLPQLPPDASGRPPSQSLRQLASPAPCNNPQTRQKHSTPLQNRRGLFLRKSMVFAPRLGSGYLSMRINR